jgi:hypothetical protein
MAAAAVPAVISGISALAGLFGGRGGTSTSKSSYDDTSTATPNFTPQQLQLISYLMPQLIQRMRDEDVNANAEAYKANGLREINTANEARTKLLQQMAAARGLQFSPAGVSPQMLNESSRIAQQTQFLETIPAYKDQMQRQRISDLMQFFTSLPTGSTQTRKGSSVGTQTQPSNMMGGLVSGLGQGLAASYGYQWALDQQKKNAAGPTAV